MKILYAARMARFDLLTAVNRLATKVTKWTAECDRQLHRIVCYVNSSDVDDRKITRDLIAADMASSTEALSLVFGDYNFVNGARDRWNTSSNVFSGDKDKVGNEQFESKLLPPYNFCELQQETPTCAGGRAVSRIDRCYSNHHASTQLTHDYSCYELRFQYGL